MKTFLILLLAAVGLAAAQTCNPANCQPPDCRCMSTSAPGNLSPTSTPQFVFLTFEDSITQNNYDNYTAILNGRKNPNGCNISMTFYVNHKNNDYVRTHSLYWMGNEMASKTISDTERKAEDWANLGTDEWFEEISGMREILSKFALVSPKLSVTGFRAPYLQTNGNLSFDAMVLAGMTYDNSYSTVNGTNPNIWPYTMDYGFQQDCQDGRGKCPTATYPGTWIVPITVLFHNKSYCAMADACPPTTNADETFEYLRSNFDRLYNSTRAPLGVYLHSAWFQGTPHTLTGYLNFLDYIQTMNDVYIVSVSKGIEWMKNPVPVNQMNNSAAVACPPVTPTTCVPRVCIYFDDVTNQDINMSSCSPCPDNYPWVGNPGGTKKSHMRLVRVKY